MIKLIVGSRNSRMAIAQTNEFIEAFLIKNPGFLREENGKLTDIPDTYDSYIKKMEDMTKSEMVDVMLMSMTSAEKLVGQKVFENSPVSPAVRLNDTSCIWGLLRHGEYDKEESRPFATTQLRHAINYVDLGLYSMTFNKNVDRDIFMLNQYRNFRDEADKIGMRHFLEVFNSAIMTLSITEMGQYINDCILKTLAGQISKEKPLFLKIAYNGPKAMEELASYDPGNLVIGILGGGKGTSRDCFELLSQACKYGARVALFGRKVNLSENQLTIIKTMRNVIENNIKSEEAVKLYHDELQKIGIKPDRDLQTDSELTEESLKM